MIRFLTAFAWRDLTDRTAWRSTSVMALTIFLVCLLTVAMFGFVYGVQRVLLDRQQRDSLALCLVVGDNLVTSRLTPEVLVELETKLRADIKKADGLEGIFPFYRTEFRFRTAKNDSNFVHLAGRTYQLEQDENGERRDPLFERRPLQEGGRIFAKPNDAGIILTPQGLAELGYARTDQPKTLNLVTQGNDVAIPVLGVTRENLSTPHSFLILPAYARKLEVSDPNPNLARVITTPLPAAWPGDIKDDLYTAVRELFKKWDLELPRFDERANKRVWFIRAKVPQEDGPPYPTLVEWNWRLRLVHETMTPPGERPKEVLRVDDSTLEREEPIPRNDYDMAAIYVRDLQSLVEAADAVEKVKAGAKHLEADRNVVDGVVAIGQQIEQAIRVLMLIEVIVLVIALANLCVQQMLRAEQKIAETGMLKAMGMTAWGLMTLEVISGTLLWLPAALAWAVGLIVQYLACLKWYQGNPREVGLGFYWSLSILLLILVLSGLISLGCGLLASWRARAASPSESLSASELMARRRFLPRLLTFRSAVPVRSIAFAMALLDKLHNPGEMGSRRSGRGRPGGRPLSGRNEQESR